MISAGKFHSAAVTADGQLLTWGWGRGGRLGEALAPAELSGYVRAMYSHVLLLPLSSFSARCHALLKGRPLPAARPPAGHPDAHVHSGEGAVIAPLVVSALGKRQVAAVAAAKHHTVLCTSAGEQGCCGFACTC